jgi:alkylation response protein AidB-like acyl-CoA dehydrogenase
MPRSPEVVASASGPAAETVLTDEMLARFAKRAPQYDRDNGLEQLFRDARLGRIHPANSMLTQEIVGKTLLGISPDETPRWG